MVEDHVLDGADAAGEHGVGRLVAAGVVTADGVEVSVMDAEAEGVPGEVELDCRVQSRGHAGVEGRAQRDQKGIHTELGGRVRPWREGAAPTSERHANRLQVPAVVREVVDQPGAGWQRPPPNQDSGLLQLAQPLGQDVLAHPRQSAVQVGEPLRSEHQLADHQECPPLPDHVEGAGDATIGYDRLSEAGPVLVLVSGGLDDGDENLPLGQQLADAFTVVTYRRRGRGDSGDSGDSGDTQPYTVQREVEDLAAVIDATGTLGDRAHLFGASSGGALCLEAAAAGLPVDRIAAHEVPYQVAEEMVTAWRDYTGALAAALEAGDRDEALRLFMRLAGSSDEQIAEAQASAYWPPLRELAPTLRYDAACLGDGPPPVDRLATVIQPVLLTTGAVIDPHMAGLPVDFFGAAADATAHHLPDGRRATIELSGHVADPAVLGPVLARFYTDTV